MGERSSVGRRRAPEPRTASDDASASHAMMATVWRAVSRAQEVLGRRLLDGDPARPEERLADLRLADQLSLVATVHDWRPLTRSEAADLVYLLGLYVEPVPASARATGAGSDATPESVARALHVAIRSMAVHRSATAAGPFRTASRDQSPEIPQTRP